MRRACCAVLWTLTSVMLAACASGCSGDRRTLDWTIRFYPPELERSGGVVLARVLWRGCDGDTLQRWELAHGEQPEGELELAPSADRIGLWARAADESCTWYAEGCVEVVLPAGTDATVETVLREQDPEPRCGAEACDEGRCGGGDAG